MKQLDSNQTPAMQPRQRGDGSCGLCRGLAEVRVVQSSELLQGRREMFIVHEDSVYRLLRTQNNKLILQK